tara:strand:+ start:506 stop:778 length:273 start_codon:yes stop_codon:yes gene_type:complete
MPSNTNILAAEIALPTTTGTATSFTEARVVRLVNTDSSAHVVTVVETQGGTGIGSFTMPATSVEFLEKEYSHCVFASNAAIKGSKVGFTH